MVWSVNQVFISNGLESLKVRLPRSADFICAFSVFNILLQLLVTRKQTEIIGEETFVLQLLVGVDEPFQLQLGWVDGVVG